LGKGLSHLSFGVSDDGEAEVDLGQLVDANERMRSARWREIRQEDIAGREKTRYDELGDPVVMALELVA
jgi:hypothetical protein